MIQALIDTDILIDSCFNREPFAADSIQILQRCELGEIEGFSTPLMMSNFYYLIRKVKTHHQAMVIVNKMNQLLTLIPITGNAVTQAIDSPFKDFEDAIQYHACTEHGNIQFIITRNKKDYSNSVIPVMTPTEFLVHLFQNPTHHPVAGA